MEIDVPLHRLEIDHAHAQEALTLERCFQLIFLDKVLADQKSSEAQQDAAAKKLDADYAVAKEKCDAFSGDTKDRCIAAAKARFAKS